MEKYYIQATLPDDYARSIMRLRDACLEMYDIDTALLRRHRQLVEQIHWTIKAPFYISKNKKDKLIFTRMIRHYLDMVQSKEIIVGSLFPCFGFWSPEVLNATRIGDPKGIPRRHTAALRVQEKRPLRGPVSFQTQFIMRCFDDYPHWYTTNEQFNLSHTSLVTNLHTEPPGYATKIYEVLRYGFDGFQQTIELPEIVLMKKVEDNWKPDERFAL